MEDKPIETIRKRFFALGREIGFDSLELKERAKKHFKETDTFNNLTKEQLTLLITKLESKQFDIKGKEDIKRVQMNLPKLISFKQLGLIQWMVRMHKPEFEKLGGYKNLKKLSGYEASMLIDYLKDEDWDRAENLIKEMHPDK